MKDSDEKSYHDCSQFYRHRGPFAQTDRPPPNHLRAYPPFILPSRPYHSLARGSIFSDCRRPACHFDFGLICQAWAEKLSSNASARINRVRLFVSLRRRTIRLDCYTAVLCQMVVGRSVFNEYCIEEDSYTPSVDSSAVH